MDKRIRNKKLNKKIMSAEKAAELIKERWNDNSNQWFYSSWKKIVYQIKYRINCLVLLKIFKRRKEMFGFWSIIPQFILIE